MSSRKDCVTSKGIQDDENTDSGFLSGPLSEQLVSGDCDVAEESVKRIADVEERPQEEEPLQLDSGLDLSECLSNISLSGNVHTPTAQTNPTETEEKSDIPPLLILFQQDDDGDTQLHIAAVHGCESSVATLLRVCPEKAWLDIPNDYGHTALHLAAMSGHAVVARMLIREGASLHLRDTRGNTPLHEAASRGYVECLQALLAPVSGQTQRRLAGTLNQKNYDGQTCVHLAAMAGHIDALHTLVYYGANINAAEGLCGWTPLHVAAARGHLATVRYLLEKCPGVDPAPLDYASRTPHRLAARTGARAAFRGIYDFSDTDSESDDDMLYESDSSLFERIRDGMNAIDVA